MSNAHRPRAWSPIELRARALESLLIEKGFLTVDAVDEIVAMYEHDIGPLNGARVVARAWTDPDFRGRLLHDGTSAVGEMGFLGLDGEHIVVLENTPQTHNVVCCTLCSCYPWPLLGLPPRWYKSAAYRARIVREPRQVLAEFGLAIDPPVQVRVWDSSAAIRYMVLPQRPGGTGGMGEEELVACVTRDSLIGVGLATLAGGTHGIV